MKNPHRKRERGSTRAGNRPFYIRGLRFACQECHECCRGGQPGWVYPSASDIERMARLVELERGAFRRRYLTRDPDGETRLRMRSNGDCVFWNDGCVVYRARPRQCRTFPFWPENLASPEAWLEAKRSCPGVGQGRLYRIEEIRAVVRGRSTDREF